MPEITGKEATGGKEKQPSEVFFTNRFLPSTPERVDALSIPPCLQVDGDVTTHATFSQMHPGVIASPGLTLGQAPVHGTEGKFKGRSDSSGQA